MNYDWTIADRISDRLIDVINEEFEAMRRAERMEPSQILAGLLLALLSLEKTMPPFASRPESLNHILDAARNCIQSMIAK